MKAHTLACTQNLPVGVVRRLGLTFSPIPVIRETDIQTSPAPETETTHKHTPTLLTHIKFYSLPGPAFNIHPGDFSGYLSEVEKSACKLLHGIHKA